MKQIKSNITKLKLKKRAISNLSRTDMENVQGGNAVTKTSMTVCSVANCQPTNLTCPDPTTMTITIPTPGTLL